MDTYQNRIISMYYSEKFYKNKTKQDKEVFDKIIIIIIYSIYYMSGSGASNIGYGNISPYISDSKYTNTTSSNNPAIFTSTEIPGLPGLAGSKNNIDAAKGYTPGICLFKGGNKIFKQKINKISRKYRMKSKKNINRIKNKLRNKYSKKSKSKSHSNKSHKRKLLRSKKMRHTRRRMYKGGSGMPSYPPGYAQYQNNQPITPTYSVGGILKPDNLGLANPPPIQLLSNCTNCVDNYNHYTGKGFPSRGH